MIVLILLVLAVVFVSLVLGRVSYEVESARDTEFVELEGRWVRYSVTGGGPPVVLVHGWLSSSRIWDQTVSKLARRFTVYTLDLAGFGESDKPTSGYGARYGSRLLYAFCAHFGLARTTIIGHDLSGVMAAKLAADHPDIVGRLVLVATPADDEQVDFPTLLWLGTLPVIGPIFFSLGRLLRPLRKQWLKSFVFDPKDLPDEFVEDAGKATPTAAAKTYSVMRHEISGGRVTRQARIIKVPILLIAGEDDQIVDPRGVEDWGQNADQAELALLDKCGHLPMVESPSEFNARILTFLTGDESYLEYVKEVPQPPAEAPVESEEDEVEEFEERQVPEETADQEETLYEEPQERSATPDPGSSIGDVSWDFSPRQTSSTPRGNKIPDEEEPVPSDKEPEPPSRRRPSKKATPLPRNRGDAVDPQPEERERPEQPPRARPKVDKGSESARIPEFPDDLFQWSQPAEESPEPRRRSRRRRAAGDDDRDSR